MRPHVAGFNEVTRTFYQIIQESEWVRKEYWISDFFESVQKKGFGNLLICRIQPICLVSIKVSTLPRNIETGFFLLKGSE